MENYLKLKPDTLRPSEFLKSIKIPKEYARTKVIVFNEKEMEKMNPEVNTKFKLLLQRTLNKLEKE